MLVGTSGTERAEASVKVRAGRTLRGWIEMEVEAIGPVLTGHCARIMCTFRHAPQVVLVEKFTRVALFAQAA